MRKYNDKMKKTMLIIGGLFVGIIVIFSLFLKKAIDVGKTVYDVPINSVLFDVNQKMISTTEEGHIRIKWGGDYYLIYQDKEYDLGSHAVVYQSNNGDITLYGKYYEVTSDGKVETIKGENKIRSSVNSKFYKLSDRRYLIIDRTIESKSSSFVTSNYLMVNLDKLGNAMLLNDKTSYKTIVPTKLATSSYIFDIANEKINFGKEDIDLKKIIGSTNEYDEETYDLNAKKKDKDGTDSTGTGTGTGDGTGNGTGTGTGNGNGTGDGTGNGTGTGTNGDGTTAGTNSGYDGNYSSAVSDEAVQEIINATKSTSVIRVTPNIDNISVDYVVYDPENEYKSVYVEVENSNSGVVNTIYLSKTDTNIELRDLTPNLYYNLTFKYTYYDGGRLKEYTFDEVGVKTSIPRVTLSVVKVVNSKIYYKLSFDHNYTISGGNINLYINDQFANISSSVPVRGSVNTISGDDCYLDISSLSSAELNGKLLSVRLINLTFNTYTVNPSASYNFRY